MTPYTSVLLVVFSVSTLQSGVLSSQIPAIDPVVSESPLRSWDCPDAAGVYQTADIFEPARLMGYRGRSIALFPGWPVEITGFQLHGGIYCNLDSDSTMEIVSNTGNKVYAWNLDGSIVTGWPQALNLFAYGAPALGDVDGDGEDEIVVGTRAGGTGNSGWLHVFEKDGSAAAGFPLSLPSGGATKTPVLCDLDGDGAMEIILEERNWPDGWICVYNGDGSVHSGWPQQMDHVPASSAAAGDITGDGVPEVVAVSYLSIYAYDASGNLLDGFPYTPAGDRCFSYSSPVLADMDGDGNREIICGDHSTTAGNGKVHVIHSDGSLMTGWPQTTAHWLYAPPAVGDIDGDGEPDIVIGDEHLSSSPGNLLYGWRSDGTDLPGFPIGPVWAVNTQVLIADFDGDQQVELLFDDNSAAGGTGHYHGYNHDGSIIAGWPLETTGTTFFKNLFAADLNMDGNVDLVGAGEDQDNNLFVHAWHTDIPVNPELNYLTILQYNRQHDGVYIPPASSGIENTDVSPALVVPLTVQCTPNPCSESVSVSVSRAQPGELISVAVRDLSGRLVQQLTAAASSGRGMAATGWDGRDASGILMPSGIYCVTACSAEGTTAARIITLLR